MVLRVVLVALQALAFVAFVAVALAASDDTVQLSETFGGPHGTEFSDQASVVAGETVSFITIRTGERVDGISLGVSAPTAQTFTHGGTGGTDNTLTLGTGEYITSVVAHWDKKDDHTRIFYLSFTTSAGNSISGGTQTDSTGSATAPDGYQLAGFYGRDGDEIDLLGAIWASIATTESPATVAPANISASADGKTASSASAAQATTVPTTTSASSAQESPTQAEIYASSGSATASSTGSVAITSSGSTAAVNSTTSSTGSATDDGTLTTSESPSTTAPTTSGPATQLSQTFGGPHGTEFSDLTLATSGQTITSITVRAGDRIDGLTLVVSAPTAQTFTHGGTGGTENTLTLGAGEYITSMEAHWGQKDGHTRIFYLSFGTSAGNSITGGTQTDESGSASAPDGYQLGGFFGRDGDEIDLLGVVWTSIVVVDDTATSSAAATVSDSDIVLSDLYGGPHGVAFSDINSILFEQTASSITIRSGERVDAVTLNVATPTEVTMNHGGSGGTENTLTLGAGEYITSMEAHWGKKDDHTRVFYLNFVTSAGNSISGGTQTDDKATATAPDGFQLGGFYGRAEDEVDQLGAIWTRISAVDLVLTDEQESSGSSLMYGTTIRNWVGSTVGVASDTACYRKSVDYNRTTDMGKDVAEDEYMLKVANMGLVVLSTIDPTGIAYMASQLCSPNSQQQPSVLGNCATGESTRVSMTPREVTMVLQALVCLLLAVVPGTLSDDSVQLSETFGGPHGTEFSDQASVVAGGTVGSITIRAGERVDGLTLEVTGPTAATFAHGGGGGDPYTLTLAAGEYITSMEAHWGKKNDHTRIFYLNFGTSAGNTVSAGSMTEDKSTVTAPEGFQLGGFFGQDGDEIDLLGAIWARIAADPPATEPAPAATEPAPLATEIPATETPAPAASEGGESAAGTEASAPAASEGGESAAGTEAPAGTDAPGSAATDAPAPAATEAPAPAATEVPSISVEDSVQLSESFGGPHGTEFSDEAAATSGQAVASITIRAGERVDGVALEITAPTATTFSHGGTGGTENKLTLAAGEYITSMEAHWGKKGDHTRIFYLSFGTSAGNSVSGGGMTEDKNSVTAPEGFQLGGFFGRDGDEIDLLGAIWTSVELVTAPPTPAPTPAPAPEEAPGTVKPGDGGTTTTVKRAIQLSESFGGPHGNQFSDQPSATSGQTITSLTVRGNKRIDGLTLEVSAPTAQTFTHGGTGGDPFTLTLGAGEYITSMDAHWGEKGGHTRIFYLNFVTSAGNAVSAGSQTDMKASITAPEGYQLGGFFGRDGDEIDLLGVVWTSIEVVKEVASTAASADEDIVLSEIFGGPHGIAFSDINAIKFGQKASSLTIRSSKRVDAVTLQVAAPAEVS
ncbi:hypothetical protein KRP22_003704 [Phytophthora ramorum]|nr:Secreted RxLR effector protein 19 [Phytophthora ramorum]